ncbi:MAG: aminotransferase class III-fold pyridoxal phosphate-dependent enzyme [Candidatus Marinimicrobia bacterium]|jgi:ornithine--oxo-acid transaminase|nr:aminotransferase class III-fold pyridoxal phosphate-dependent enzyme [Candidatus Neomarinimicrobiota bacterium]MBT4554959.1 aminotransferase class III-fold pyridoxal phosphate-dependent enzyme [Candidatus Neomarinimicrobiota bacterium]MBT4753245.1 aminotransferase class III-fold pyridoxal phosphate-dependent enzyme [Candidatus Neomarinimicrobiota bacterium]
MSSVSITGYGDNLSVNGIRIGDLTPAGHESIEKEKGGLNYSPLENVVISHVKDSSTLIARRPDPHDVEKYIETEIIDGLCCYSAVNQGQLNQTIVDAVVKHLTEEKLPTVPRSIRHKYMSAFLLATTGISGMDRVVPKVAGVEAPELMFKISRRWGYRVKGIPKGEALVVAANGNFHGRSMTAVSLSDDPDAKEDFGPFVPGIEMVPFNDFNALESLFEEKSERIASFMVEPIQGEAGVIVPDDDYFQRVSVLCKKHNVLLAMDEVQTGFGRTGANFAHQLFGVKPDLMGCGKAAGGGILPISFVAGTDEAIGVLTPGSEGSTFGGYPLAAVVGTYAIKVMVDENLAENATNMGGRLIGNMESIKSDFPDKIKEVRGRGLLTAFEMYDEPHLDGHAVSVGLLEEGVYAKETHHSTVRLAPALTINKTQIDALSDAIRTVVKGL